MAKAPATADDDKPESRPPARRREPAPAAATEPAEDAVLTHPEEMRATLNVSFGGGGTLTATARCTPAGLVTTGLMVSGILLSVASVIWATRRNPGG